MNSKAFNGIMRGQTIRKDGSGKKIHDFFEMHFDPALTANHGSPDVLSTCRNSLGSPSLLQTVRANPGGPAKGACAVAAMHIC